MAETVLVTGARGFVGRHLLRELGRRAVGTDADVRDPEALVQAVRTARPGAVVHLAGLSSVADSWKRGLDVWHVNALGTVNLLDAVRAEAPEARTLVVSTGEVYGETAEGPADEGQQVSPVSPYAASKAAAELACFRAARAEGLDIVVARPFQHVGPGQEERFALASWAAQIARLERGGGGELEVGDLSVERDVTDVRDVCRAYALLLDPLVPAGVYNVCSGKTIRLEALVDRLIALARAPVTIRRSSARVRRVDLRVLVGDPARIRAATGWQPEIPVEQTVSDLLEAARTVEGESEAKTA